MAAIPSRDLSGPTCWLVAVLMRAQLVQGHASISLMNVTRSCVLRSQGTATERSDQAPGALLRAAASTERHADSSADPQSTAVKSQPYEWSPDDVGTADTRAACQSPVAFVAVLGAALGCTITPAPVTLLKACSADGAPRTAVAEPVHLCKKCALRDEK